MNKYQEALENITEVLVECGRTKDLPGETIFEEQIELNLLQELVDKATPKKPIKDEPSQIRYVQTYKCSNCGGRFSGTISNYCYHCGQAIDWSNEC